MATYRTTDQAVYLSDKGLMVFVGEEFTTDNVPGSTWEPVDDEALAKCRERFPDRYPDPLDHDGDGRKGGSRKRSAVADSDG